MERACGPVLQEGFGAGGHLAVCGTVPPDDVSDSECTGVAAVPLARRKVSTVWIFLSHPGKELAV